MKKGDIILSKDGKRIFQFVDKNDCAKCPFSCLHPGNDRSGYCLDIAHNITGKCLDCGPEAHYIELLPNLDSWRNLK